MRSSTTERRRRPPAQLVEVAEPALGHCAKPLGLEPVDVLTPAQFDRDQPSLLEHAQVLGDRRPRMLEPRRDSPGCHLPAAGVQDREYCPPGPMGQGAEDRVKVVELGEPARPRRHVPSATRS